MGLTALSDLKQNRQQSTVKMNGLRPPLTAAACFAICPIPRRNECGIGFFYVITVDCVGGVVMPILSVSVLGLLSWLAFLSALCL